jgi:hypothetical protein
VHESDDQKLSHWSQYILGTVLGAGGDEEGDKRKQDEASHRSDARAENWRRRRAEVTCSIAEERGSKASARLG